MSMTSNNDKPLETICMREITRLVQVPGDPSMMRITERMYKEVDVHSAVKLVNDNIDGFVAYLQFAKKAEREIKAETGEPIKYEHSADNMIFGLQYAQNCLVQGFPVAFTTEEVKKANDEYEQFRTRGRTNV
jgi:hypothetical protein